MAFERYNEYIVKKYGTCSLESHVDKFHNLQIIAIPHLPSTDSSDTNCISQFLIDALQKNITIYSSMFFEGLTDQYSIFPEYLLRAASA